VASAREAERSGFHVPGYVVWAEFRRRDREAPWVIAGVTIEHEFWPAVDGVEAVSERLPAPGLVGWARLPTPVVAPDVRVAAQVGLDVARVRWPARVRATVPYASGRRHR
jgi:hypothetical protein